MKKIIITETSIAVCNISNDELSQSLKFVIDTAEKIFGSIRLHISIETWDMDYGDVAPSAFICARPDLTSWNAAQRIKRHKHLNNQASQ